MAYFYFDYKDNVTQEPSKVVAGLLKQLLCRLDAWPREIEKAYATSLKTGSELNYNELLDLLIAVSSHFSTVYVLIDALDEVEWEHQPAFLSLIQHLSESSIKTLVTSRPHLEICHEFEMSGLSITISANDLDIRQYLSVRLNKRKHLASGLKKKIVETLSINADGM